MQSPVNNPFQTGNNRLRTGEWPQENARSCILYSYDLDEDGRVGIGRCPNTVCAAETDSDNVEQFGFRLRERKLQSRYAGHSFQCDNGNWQAVSDPNIEITALEFTLSTHCVNLRSANADCQPNAPSLNSRSVAIHLQGQLQNQPDTRITVRQSVHIRNDLLVE
jgi:type II secretory pathway component PulJ